MRINKTWLIIVAIVVGVFLLSYACEKIAGQEQGIRLSRDEQIQIMKECREDAKRCGSRISDTTMAFWEYRIYAR